MSSSEKHLYEFGEFRLNTGERLLLRNGHPVSLPPKVFDTLVMLVQHSGHLLDREQLIKEQWRGNFIYYVKQQEGAGELYQIPDLGGPPRKLKLLISNFK